MSVYDEIKCPYCGDKFDASELEFGDCNEMDIECDECGEEFEVHRDWHPSYSSTTIDYTDCGHCGTELRVGRTYHGDNKTLCNECYSTWYFKSIEED